MHRVEASQLHDPQRNFLIIVSNVLVAEDIAQTILANFSEPRIIACRTVEEALVRWPSFGRVDVMIAAAPPEVIYDSGLGAKADLLPMQRILVTSSDRMVSLPGWQILPLPFSEAMLIHALES